MKGYSGKIPHVDLTKGAFSVEQPSEAFYRQYVGGACMGNYYVFKGMTAGADPLGPENVLVFAISALVGAPISGNARHAAGAKSPLTGTIASSEGGGYWGPELRFAGFDAIVITGKSPKQVYLWVHDGQYELKDASHLRGKVTGEVQHAIRSELGDQRIRVAQIGPAGEKGVLFANITNELKHFNGRCRLGAVMGSKNLRAIAVRGKMKPEYANPDRIKELAKKGAAKIAVEGFYKDWKRVGTDMNVTWNTDIGGLPTRNWTMGTFPEREKISEFVYADEWMDGSGTCWACAQACKRDIKKGILSAKELGGVEAPFGSGEALVRLSETAVKREGFGDKMALGAARLARMLGPKAERIAVTRKGKEFPAHMPTAKGAMGLIYAVNPFGPDHVSTTHDGDITAEPNEVNKGVGLYETAKAYELNFAKTKMVVCSQRYVSAIDSWSVCQFTFHAWTICSLAELVEVINAATGWQYTLHEFMLLGERRINLMRAFNAREGFSSKEDVLPPRLHDDPLVDNGPRKGAVVDKANFLKQRENYYVMSGWGCRLHSSPPKA
jgi:aldehyde:ferredoxin oxidoreductase